MITKVQLTASTSPKWKSTVRPKADLHLHLVTTSFQAPCTRFKLHQLPTSSVQGQLSRTKRQLLQVQSARGRVAGGLSVNGWTCRSLLSSSRKGLNQILMLQRCLVLWYVCVSYNAYHRKIIVIYIHAHIYWLCAMLYIQAESNDVNVFLLLCKCRFKQVHSLIQNEQMFIAVVDCVCVRGMCLNSRARTNRIGL